MGLQLPLTAVGMWAAKKKELHISVLEWKTVQLALNDFKDMVIGKDLVLMSNSVTVVAYLKKHGGTVPLDMFRLAKDIAE